jgi:uncharacterized protein YjbI with pentapeptide repeats
MEKKTQQQSREEPHEEQRQKSRRGKLWEWTGFGEKTAWDWMQLLIVPLVLAVGAFLFNYSLNARQQENEEMRAAAQLEAEEQRAQEEALRVYLQEMVDLMLDEGLLSSEEEDEIRTLARARTVTVLRQVEGTRKRDVIQFLSQSGLISNSARGANIEPVIVLYEADLSGTTLDGLDLPGAGLAFANLSDTDLWHADLQGADLQGADLSDADLRGADLSDADLPEVDLEGADLEGAELSGANLEDARGVTIEDLEEKAASLEGATMPDETKHD